MPVQYSMAYKIYLTHIAHKYNIGTVINNKYAYLVPRVSGPVQLTSDQSSVSRTACLRGVLPNTSPAFSTSLRPVAATGRFSGDRPGAASRYTPITGRCGPPPRRGHAEHVPPSGVPCHVLVPRETDERTGRSVRLGEGRGGAVTDG